MNEEARLFEVLGVRPGATRAELKTAYRDLAKVWHPDRFGHDPQLQTKAQEKLKEINEAYNELISGRPKRRAAAPKAQPNHDSTYWWEQAARATANYPPARKSSKRPRSWPLTFVTIAVFGLGFVFTVQFLMNRNKEGAEQTLATDQKSVAEENVSSTEKDGATVEKSGAIPAAKKSDSESVEDTAVETPPVEQRPQQAMATETAVIDPSSGLLARSDCPVKSRMTFVSGNQPRQYCNVLHAAPTPKDSRIKSVARKLGIQ